MELFLEQKLVSEPHAQRFRIVRCRLRRFKFQVTLALDSQALCCASGVNDILSEGPGEFDIAFAVQV